MITHGRYEHHTKYFIETYTTGKAYARTSHKRHRKYISYFSLVNTLYETREFQCKDQRDKVFGVLSLVTDIGPEDEVLRPNYRASVEEVLETVAKWDIQKNESLQILSYCSRKYWTHPNLPSWVADFSDIDDANSVYFPLRVKRFQFEKPRQRNHRKSKSGFKNNDQPSFFKENGKTVLEVTGQVVDIIASVGTVIDEPRIPLSPDAKQGDKDLAKSTTAAVSKRRKWFHECVQIALATDPVSPQKARTPYHCLEISQSRHVRAPDSKIPQSFSAQGQAQRRLCQIPLQRQCRLRMA